MIVAVRNEIDVIKRLDKQGTYARAVVSFSNPRGGGDT